MSKPLTPLVDFARTFLLEQFDPTAGAYVATTTGSITCYIADADDAEVAADPALTGTATYIGGNGDQPAGTWFFGIDAAALTFELLDSLFLDANDRPMPAYFIILKPSGVRIAEKLSYKRVKKATAV